MRKFKFSKLVRDRVVEKIEEGNGIVQKRILNETEFRKELFLKLIEEATEMSHAKESDIESEFADVYEIIQLVKKELGLNDNTLTHLMREKQEKAGAFDDRIYIDYVEVPEDSSWIEYYSKNRERYPEIKN